MKRWCSQSIRTLVLLFATSASLAWAQSEALDPNHSCDHDAKTLRCVKFIGNHDGDTVTFDVPNVHPLLGKKISVRVLGLDTAEMTAKDACEKAAAVKARLLVGDALRKAERIDLVHIHRDKYFRILADVMVDGENLREKIFAAGLAYAYMGGTKVAQNWCLAVGS